MFKLLVLIVFLSSLSMFACSSCSNNNDREKDSETEDDSGNETDSNDMGDTDEWIRYPIDKVDSYGRNSWRAATLSDGSAVVTGAFNNDVTFGRGEPGEVTLKGPTEQYVSSRYLARFRPNGTLAFAKRCDECGDLAVLSDDTFLSSIVGVVKFDKDGNRLWSVDIDPKNSLFDIKKIPGVERGRRVDVFDDGSFMLLGAFIGSMTLGEGEPNETVMEGPEKEEVGFLARYNADGELIWARKLNSVGFSMSFWELVCLSEDDGCVIGGIIWEDTVILNEGAPDETTLTSLNKGKKDIYDLFFAKYDGKGNLAWVNQVGGIRAVAWAPFDISDMVALDNDTFLVAITIPGTAVFNKDEPDEVIFDTSYSSVVVAKYKSDGALLWVNKIDSDHAESGGLAVFPDSSIGISGIWGQTITFGKGRENEITFKSSSGDTSDCFTAKLSADGSFEWAKRIFGTSSCYAVSAAPDRGIYLAGEYSWGYFEKGEPNEVALPKSGWSNMFIARYAEE